MNTRFCSILLAGSLLLPTWSNAQQTAQPERNPLFSLTPDYKAGVHLDESIVSPFRKPADRVAQAALQANKAPAGPNVSEVISKFHERGLNGVIPSTSKRVGVIILGGEIFVEGSEIAFPQKTSKQPAPLLQGHKVRIQSITREALSLSIGLNSDTASPLTVPVGLLEFLDL